MSGIDIICPYCDKHFRVDTKHIRQSVFPARCGSCKQLFNLDGDALLAKAAAKEEQAGYPAFLCLAGGKEIAASVQSMEWEKLTLLLRKPLSDKTLQSIARVKCSLRIGLHQADTSWEYFITFSCEWIQVDGLQLQVGLTILPHLPWLAVEEHGLYLYVVRSGGILEGGWKPLKFDQIPHDAPTPNTEKRGLVLCAMHDPVKKRMQFKPYPLANLLTIQQIAMERQLLQPDRDITLRPSRQQSDTVAVSSQPTLFQQFGGATQSCNLSPEDAKMLREVVKPPVAPPSPPEEEDDVTARDFAKPVVIRAGPEEEYTAREDTAPVKSALQDAEQRSKEARLRWIAGRLAE